MDRTCISCQGQSQFPSSCKVYLASWNRVCHHIHSQGKEIVDVQFVWNSKSSGVRAQHSSTEGGAAQSCLISGTRIIHPYGTSLSCKLNHQVNLWSSTSSYVSTKVYIYIYGLFMLQSTKLACFLFAASFLYYHFSPQVRGCLVGEKFWRIFLWRESYHLGVVNVD